MKIPCEIVVWHVLPMIRREIAKELVNTHSMSQAEVARKFGVTDAAISQYLKKKRGDNTMIEQSSRYPQFLDEIKVSASHISEGKSRFENEMCRLCGVVKRIGLLDEIYYHQFGEPCGECHHMGSAANLRTE
jgi:hypothetical protein